MANGDPIHWDVCALLETHDLMTSGPATADHEISSAILKLGNLIQNWAFEENMPYVVVIVVSVEGMAP